MNRQLQHRFATAALVAGLALSVAGCITNEAATRLPSRASAPLKPETLALLEEKGMSKSSPIVVRLFKQESELEVWKPTREGRYELFKTYPICRWSGELGPKIKEGDRQAPEGFYTIVPGLMNPNSSYYLAFNTGFPNAFDRAHGRSGGDVMVHGDCSSRGCFAMTDEQIAEIYALGRESFAGGQRSFQVQAYPFRMTAENLAKHRNNPHMAFWRMLKEGNDQFLVSRQALKVDVCEKKYVFNANPTAGGRFDPTGPCPAFEVPSEIAAAAAKKRAADDAKVAALLADGVTPAPVKTGTDGGMHPVFLAAVKGVGDPSLGDIIRSEPFSRLPGTVPAHAVPPREPTVAAAPAPAKATADKSTAAKPAQKPATAVASASSSSSSSSSSGNWFTRLFSSREDKPDPEITASTPASPAPSRTASASASTPQPPARPAAVPQTATPAQAAKPAPSGTGAYALASTPRERPGTIPAAPAQTQAAAPTAAKPSTSVSAYTAPMPAPGSLIGGAAPVLETGGFSR
ncbi:L,D-transpeptidase family protein [Blastochloris tepida]|uniref:L,D-TPase catalytic domain-containing protein n=1 Tax=Blastochloris tepida TaxID=2233851 RepID=A0A348FVI7_9HYPH|nr:murein L,D-transpeptidase family protein [Blastochloris tepida]BBF91320.1 hypothetical protein BLTE_00050 [Blastochloris tepida]